MTFANTSQYLFSLKNLVNLNAVLSIKLQNHILAEKAAVQLALIHFADYMMEQDF